MIAKSFPADGLYKQSLPFFLPTNFRFFTHTFLHAKLAKKKNMNLLNIPTFGCVTELAGAHWHRVVTIPKLILRYNNRKKKKEKQLHISFYNCQLWLIFSMNKMFTFVWACRPWLTSYCCLCFHIGSPVSTRRTLSTLTSFRWLSAVSRIK